MLVEFEYRGDICVLRLEGRFATGQDSLYLHTKAEELKTSGYVKILVDFSRVDYVDSTGIGFLIGIYTSVKKSPLGQFALANAEPPRARGAGAYAAGASDPDLSQ